MLFFCLLQNSQRTVSYIWVPAFHALEIPYSNKDKNKAHMKKTALDLLCLFQICFSSLTIFRILLSHSTHAYSKATQCTLYMLCTNIVGILQYRGCTLQKCLISHPWLRDTHLLLMLSEHVPWTTWRRIPLQKRMLCYLGENAEVWVKVKINAVYIVWRYITCTYYSDFILEDCCFLGLKGQGQPEVLALQDRTPSSMNIINLFWDSLSSLYNENSRSSKSAY